MCDYVWMTFEVGAAILTPNSRHHLATVTPQIVYKVQTCSVGFMTALLPMGVRRLNITGRRICRRSAGNGLAWPIPSIERSRHAARLT
jgi:hypothetical protein